MHCRIYSGLEAPMLRWSSNARQNDLPAYSPHAIKGENTMQVENLMIQSVLSNWRLTTTRLTNFLTGLAESSFYEEIAPGRNRIIYVLGHLTAVHDLTLEVLGFGGREHPELDEVFIKNPDRVILHSSQSRISFPSGPRSTKDSTRGCRPLP